MSFSTKLAKLVAALSRCPRPPSFDIVRIQDPLIHKTTGSGQAQTRHTCNAQFRIK